MLKVASSGGKQVLSLQTPNSNLHFTVKAAVDLSLMCCLNKTSFSNEPTFILKNLSNFVCAFGSMVLPAKLYPFEGVKVNSVFVGPPSSICCEYMCQPSSIVAFKNIVAAVGLVRLATQLHFT